MASREQAAPTEAAASETASWLPTLSALSLGELATLDPVALDAPLEQLKRRVNKPLSTIAGSSGS
ncbi:hypothetical protein ACWEQW_01630 [Streptomyces nigra]